MAGDAPGIGQLLSICSGEAYKGTMLCRLVDAYAAGDRGAAVGLARDLLGLVRELSGAGRGGGP
ncbi:MAG TPA: hypothetical protein EYH50_03820, partial [Pyrodictium delaneyi]|nr:hypothetical protein [Pyrodictium delaneyi]